MSADISAVRGVSAPETSDAVWATDGLDLSTDESYAAGCAVAQPPAGQGSSRAARRARCLYLRSPAWPRRALPWPTAMPP